MRAFGIWKILLWILLLLFPFLAVFAQNPISEMQDTKFQTHFFEALKQKSIGNFDKAIISLESCQQINPASKAVFFELSKNNLSLKHFIEAEHFVNKALQHDAQNIFLLQHLANIYKEQQDYTKAIKVYSKIIEQQPNKVGEMIQLYLLNGQSDKAIEALNKLETKGRLTTFLKKRRDFLQARLAPKQVASTKTVISIDAFKKTKDYNTLKKLITHSLSAANYQKALEISELGLQYFPAQPFLYLSKAQALNKLLKYDQAIETLEIGLDFVIDNKKLEKQFYNEFVTAFKNTNNSKQLKKYKKLLVQ